MENGTVRRNGFSARLLRSGRYVLATARRRRSFPFIVGLMAVVSSGTALFPFMPVLVMAAALAPSRWRAIYAASVFGAATGAGLLAAAIQFAGESLVAGGLPKVDTLPQWLEAAPLIRSYGAYALTIVAALPVPQVPVLLALALAKTSPLTIAAAVLVGKAIKYGTYIAGTELVVAVVRRWLRRE
jgi:hypothetical protein